MAFRIETKGWHEKTWQPFYDHRARRVVLYATEAEARARSGNILTGVRIVAVGCSLCGSPVGIPTDSPSGDHWLCIKRAERGVPLFRLGDTDCVVCKGRGFTGTSLMTRSRGIECRECNGTGEIQVPANA